MSILISFTGVLRDSRGDRSRRLERPELDRGAELEAGGGREMLERAGEGCESDKRGFLYARGPVGMGFRPPFSSFSVWAEVLGGD